VNETSRPLDPPRADESPPGEARCPYCHDAIHEGVACKSCGTPHHLDCWRENGRCTTAGCGSTSHGDKKPVSAARRSLSLARKAKKALVQALENARERFGGKTVVGLFLLASAITGLGLAPLLYHVHASKKVDIGVVLGAVFAILAGWITTLLYRGAALEDDLQLEVAAGSVGDYYDRLSGVEITTSSSPDPIGFLVEIVLSLLFSIVVSAVLPLVAWFAVEVLFPLAVLSVYVTLYNALALAVNGAESFRGRFLASLARGTCFSALYTGIVGLILLVAFFAFHANLRAP
jgi:hypothetical protein